MPLPLTRGDRVVIVRTDGLPIGETATITRVDRGIAYADGRTFTTEPVGGSWPSAEGTPWVQAWPVDSDTAKAALANAALVDDYIDSSTTCRECDGVGYTYRPAAGYRPTGPDREGPTVEADCRRCGGTGTVHTTTARDHIARKDHAHAHQDPPTHWNPAVADPAPRWRPEGW